MDIWAELYLWLAWEEKILTARLQNSVTSETEKCCIQALQSLSGEHKHHYIEAPIFQPIQNLLNTHTLNTLNCYKLVWALAELAVSHTSESSTFKVVNFKGGKKPEHLLEVETFVEFVEKIETVQLPIPSILKNALQNPNNEIRNSSTFILGRIHQPIAINTLLKIAQDKNQATQFRLDALKSLKNIQDNQSYRILKQIAQDRNETTGLRLATLNTFQMIVDPKIIDFLKQTIQDRQQQPELRLAAIQAISHIKDLQAVNLNPGLVDLQAINLLQNIIQNQTESLDIRLASIRSLGKFKHEQVINFFKQLISNKTKNIQIHRATIQALGKIRANSAHSILKEIIENKQEAPELRQAALSELTGVPREFSVFQGSLYGFENLEETNSTVNEIKVYQTIRILQNIARDVNEEEALRKIAILGLGKVKDNQAVNTLTQIAQDPNQTQELQKAAIESLGKIGNPQAIRFLKIFLNHLETQPNLIDNLKFASETAQTLALASPEDGIPILLDLWKKDINKFNNLIQQEISTQGLGTEKIHPRICQYNSYVNTLAKIGKPAKPFLEAASQPEDSETFKQFTELTSKVIDQDLCGYYNELCRPSPRARVGWWFQQIGSFFGNSNYF
ncbi:MAG: HEAT repeat domain-containing protein [Cyanobacteria bacterium J06592_8]